MAYGLSSALGITGLIFIVIGIIMAIVGIVLLIVNTIQPAPWYIWFLLVGGIILGIIGGIMLAVSYSYAPSTPLTTCETQCQEYEYVAVPKPRPVPIPAITPVPTPLYMPPPVAYAPPPPVAYGPPPPVAYAPQPAPVYVQQRPPTYVPAAAPPAPINAPQTTYVDRGAEYKGVPATITTTVQQAEHGQFDAYPFQEPIQHVDFPAQEGTRVLQYPDGTQQVVRGVVRPGGVDVTRTVDLHNVNVQPVGQRAVVNQPVGLPGAGYNYQ